MIIFSMYTKYFVLIKYETDDNNFSMYLKDFVLIKYETDDNFSAYLKYFVLIKDDRRIVKELNKKKCRIVKQF